MRLSKLLFTTWNGVKLVAKLVGYLAEQRRYYTRPIAITAQTIQAPVIAAVRVLPVVELPEPQPERLLELQLEQSLASPTVPVTVTSSSTTSQQQSDRDTLVEELQPELLIEPTAVPGTVMSSSTTSQQQSDRDTLVEELQPERLLEPTAVPGTVMSSSTTRRRQQSDRGKLVEELLEQASGQGAVTYEDFISFVKEQTGEGCSRRTVAIWKKSRRLIDATT